MTFKLIAKMTNLGDELSLIGEETESSCLFQVVYSGTRMSIDNKKDFNNLSEAYRDYTCKCEFMLYMTSFSDASIYFQQKAVDYDG